MRRIGFRMIPETGIARLGGGGGLSVFGGGSGFNPLSLAPSLWIAGRFITGLNDGDAIATPVERSGTNNITTQLTESKRASWRANVVNGFPVIRFVGASFTNYTFPNNINLPLTVFMVVKDTGSASKYIMSTGAAGISVLIRGNIANWRVLTSAFSTASYKINAAFRIIAVVVRAANDLDMITDGIVETKTDGSGASSAGRSIGSFNSSTDFADADLAELIVISGALAAPQVAQLGAYLKGIYNLPFA